MPSQAGLAHDSVKEVVVMAVVVRDSWGTGEGGEVMAAAAL